MCCLDKFRTGGGILPWPVFGAPLCRTAYTRRLRTGGRRREARPSIPQVLRSKSEKMDKLEIGINLVNYSGPWNLGLCIRLVNRR